DAEKPRDARPGDGQRVRAVRSSSVAPPRPPREEEDDVPRALTETEDLRVDGPEEAPTLSASGVVPKMTPTPPARPRPSVRGLTKPEEPDDLRGEIARRVRST